jgi:predicted nucleotidyltransferase
VDESALVTSLRSTLPDVQAMYVFGSVARGDERAGSDLDLAVLCPRPLPSATRWELQGRLAALVHRNVDLVDLRAASAVLRVNVLDDARLLYDGAPFERALFEATACADYARLQEERREILEQVIRDGHVYG